MYVRGLWWGGAGRFLLRHEKSKPTELKQVFFQLDHGPTLVGDGGLGLGRGNRQRQGRSEEAEDHF